MNGLIRSDSVNFIILLTFIKVLVKGTGIYRSVYVDISLSFHSWSNVLMFFNIEMSMKQYRLPTENMLPEYASIVWFMKYTSLSGAIAYEPEVVYIIYEPLPGSLNVEPWSGSGTAAPILVHMSMNHPNGSYFGTFVQNFLNQSLVQKFWFIFEPAQRFVFWHVDWHQYWFLSEPIFLTV